MTSNALPTPSNPFQWGVCSNPLIPPGALEAPPWVGTPGGNARRVSVLGIDPGFSGAMAWLDLGGDLRVEDMPTLTVERNGKAKRDLDLAALVELTEQHRPAFAVVERVGAMPGQGVSSMFAFGRGFGSILGVLAALRVPVELVTPAAWKRTLAVPQGKDGARLRASQLLPAHGGHWRRAKDDGRAEASMLAWYGLAYLSNRPGFALGQAQDSTAGVLDPVRPIFPMASVRPSNGDCEEHHGR